MEQRRPHQWLERHVEIFLIALSLVFGRMVLAQVRYSISEEQKDGAVVGNIAKDLGIDHRTLKERGFRIVSTSGESLFIVNQNDGVLYVNGKIDREEVCERFTPCLINLKIALENPLEIHYVTVDIIDVNDHAPKFPEHEKRLEIGESVLPGARFQLQAARDPDSGSNSVQIYKLSHTEYFRIDIKDRDRDGKVPFLILQKPLDREITKRIELQLTALDGGRPPKSGTMEIKIDVLDINDNAPVFTKDTYSVILNENTPVGTTVLRVNATDSDEGHNGEVVYSLGHNVNDKVFDVNPITGDITVIGILNFEVKDVYEIDIQASDKGIVPLTTDKSVTIKIADVNENAPQIEVTSFSKTVPEDSKPGTTVALISVSDLDSEINGRVSCSIPEDIPFKLMPSSQDNTYSLVTTSTLDRETISHYEVILVAKDAGQPPLSSVKTITVQVSDVNDNSPEFSFSPYAFYNDNVPVILYPVSANGSAEGVEEIPRNVNAGHLVTKVRAYDADIGYNGWLLFSLQEVSDHSLFSLDRYTGQIRTLRSFTETDEAQHKLVILVKDNGNVSLSATATVIVKVVEPKEAFAASDVKNAVKDEEENNVTFYLIITLGSVSVLFITSIIVLIVMQCSKSTDYSSKYLQDTNYDGTLCHSIQYRSGDKRYMLVGPRMSIGSTLAPGSNRNTLVIPDRRRRDSEEVREYKV
ncbi:protocadherin gamma-C4-like [Triplophysa rosa]|uniref:protocadherin gamma-C4-like n=1 Tax=Triplophysa rosa TaxID=992332 RepID=UPI002545E340|nr:protocadherin gamma-C4-like [Triplophysa rosa]